MRREGLRLVRLAVFSQKPHLHDISEQRYISVFQDAPMKVPFRALLSDPLHFFLWGFESSSDSVPSAARTKNCWTIVGWQLVAFRVSDFGVRGSVERGRPRSDGMRGDRREGRALQPT